jgi:hypothetical protein
MILRSAIQISFLPLLVLAACGGHPLAGGWHQHVATGTGMELEFDAGSNKLVVHGAPAADGTHEHHSGTYALDGQRLQLEWTEGGKTVSWSGELRGDVLELQGAGGRVEFHRGSSDHDH